MDAEEFEEWDNDFLNEVVQVAEHVISSTQKPKPNTSESHNPPSCVTTFTSSYLQQPPLQQQQSVKSVLASDCNDGSFSPPRELSQRTMDLDSFYNSSTGIAKNTYSVGSTSRRLDTDKDREIERLKRELGRVSEQLMHLEQDCLNLKNERDKKEEQLKFAVPKEEKNADANHLKSTNFGREYGVFAPDHHGISQRFQNGIASKNQTKSGIDIAKPTFKSIGLQTNKASNESAQDFSNDDLPACSELSQKLLAIWGSTCDQNLGRNVVSKLLVACQTDFHLLFGCMHMDQSSKITMKLLADGRFSSAALRDRKDSFHTAEAAKVSHLYSVLTKIIEGMDRVDALIEPLLILCHLENVAVVHSSLCILHVFLKHLSSLEKNCGRRDNVLVEGLRFGNDVVDCHGFEGAKDGNLFHMSKEETSLAGCDPPQIRFSNAEILSKRGYLNHRNAVAPSVDWASLFEAMHQIAMKISEACVRVEAVSIMNVILVRSNAYFEREKICQVMIFETVSQLLRKEAGLHVKKHTLQLLYLLLSCPKVLVTFCSGCKEGEQGAVDDNACTSNSQRFKTILQGLADCVACHGNGIQELKLRRNAILVLAFLASSGKGGFEIFVSHRLSREENFLSLILQVLVSEMDIEVAGCTKPPEIFRQRTLLMRETLILLNRLVSNPSYSAAVLRGLTNNRDIASLTIDIVNRLSWKSKKFEEHESMERQMRETEIVDLARVLKKRVFAYLGD
ncbi:putative Dimerizations protein [Quillaja saponaria]|uniref:Dimerizations protein n=1 Tax=Quillaja saponaria TaxID=32244 RepID=A0AAD7KQ00_QUISA|nr:putative Dimerizations protein [Quillaja saponaria]